MDIAPKQLVLFGVFRPRPTPPGFGIPVFSDATDLWVQEVGKAGTVERFVKCDVEPVSLLPIPLEARSEPWIQQVGQRPIHAFQMPDGRVEVGRRDILAETVKWAVSEDTHPFVSLDIAKFLGDSEREQKARAACVGVLKREAEKARRGWFSRVVHAVAARIRQVVAAINAILDRIKQWISITPQPVAYFKYLALVVPFLLLSIAMVRVYFYIASPSPIRSLAILRFSNVSNEPDKQFLTSSFPQSLYADFTQFARLRLVDGTNASRYQTGLIDPQEVGRDLNVKAVLLGKFLPSGEIQVDLMDAGTGERLWGQRYSRFENLIAVQKDIRREILGNLRLSLTDTERLKFVGRDTTDSKAYEHYLIGRYFWNKRSADDLITAIREFKTAIWNDPDYALAYVGLADCYLLQEEYAEIWSSDSITRAQDAIERALQINPLLAEAHTSRARASQNLWQWEKAEDEYKRAIELNPQYATAHQWYSSFFTDMNRLDDALFEIKRAQELDPLSPIITGNVGYIYYFKGELSSAEKEFQKLIKLDPSFPMAYAGLGLVRLRQGDSKQAIFELDKAVNMSDRFGHAVSDLGYAYAVAGDRISALKLINELEEKSLNEQTAGINVAAVYVGLADKEQAFSWLERDLQNRNYELTRLVSDPIFNPLRSDPRYASLLQRMGLRR